MTDDARTCRKCGETVPRRRDLSMHDRVVHGGPLQLGLADKRGEQP